MIVKEIMKHFLIKKKIDEPTNERMNEIKRLSK